MVVNAIGIDSVDISRFTLWATYPRKKLLRIFCPEEIDYCLNVPAKSAERFAGRFASKEALFKAFCQKNSNNLIPFLTFCQGVAIVPTMHGPRVRFNQTILKQNVVALVSITHTAQICTAMAMITSEPEQTN